MKSNCPPATHFKRWRRLTAALFLGLLVVGSFPWFPWFKGSLSGTTLLGLVPFVDPLAALESSLASRTVTREVLWGAGLLLTAAAALGAVFCGWLCPLGLVLDLNQSLRAALFLFPGRLPISLSPPAAMTAGLSTRGAILAGLMTFAVLAQVPLFQIISPISLLVRSLVFHAPAGLLVVGLIVLAEHRWPRLWCRRLCPLGALYGAVGRLGFLRVRINPDTAGQHRCRHCTLHCPMGIAVMEDYVLQNRRAVTDSRCIRCGECVDRCPGNVLKLGFRPHPPVVCSCVETAGHCSGPGTKRKA